MAVFRKAFKCLESVLKCFRKDIFDPSSRIFNLGFFQSKGRTNFSFHRYHKHEIWISWSPFFVSFKMIPERILMSWDSISNKKVINLWEVEKGNLYQTTKDRLTLRFLIFLGPKGKAKAKQRILNMIKQLKCRCAIWLLIQILCPILNEKRFFPFFPIDCWNNAWWSFVASGEK